jgi:hypothetical protein
MKISLSRVPLPACADTATFSINFSGTNCQTILHPEQWLQWLLSGLVPAELREESPVCDACRH